MCFSLKARRAVPAQDLPSSPSSRPLSPRSTPRAEHSAPRRAGPRWSLDRQADGRGVVGELSVCCGEDRLVDFPDGVGGGAAPRSERSLDDALFAETGLTFAGSRYPVGDHHETIAGGERGRLLDRLRAGSAPEAMGLGESAWAPPRRRYAGSPAPRVRSWPRAARRSRVPSARQRPSSPRVGRASRGAPGASRRALRRCRRRCGDWLGGHPVRRRCSRPPGSSLPVRRPA